MILAVLVLLGVLLALPVGLSLSYRDAFSFSVAFAGIPLPIGKRKNKKKTEQPRESATDTKKPKKENFLMKIYREKGLTETISIFSSFVREVIERLNRLLKRLKIRNLNFVLTVATDHAAKTAITFGTVCGILYPAFSLLKQRLDCKEERFDILTDFEAQEPSFSVSADVKASLFTLLRTVLAVLKQIKKLQHETVTQSIKDVDRNE